MKIIFFRQQPRRPPSEMSRSAFHTPAPRYTQNGDRGVVADDIQVSLGGVEPQREPARVTPVSGLPRSPATVENRISVSSWRRAETPQPGCRH
jgi:hypothetical protein